MNLKENLKSYWINIVEVNKKRMKGLLKVYVRPTYQFSIKTLLKN